MSELMSWCLGFLRFGIRLLFNKEVKQTMKNVKRKPLCILSDTRWITLVPASSKLGRIWERGIGITQTFFATTRQPTLLGANHKIIYISPVRITLSDFRGAFWMVSNHLSHLLLNHNFICCHSFFKLFSYFMLRSFTQHFPNQDIILSLSYQEYWDRLPAVSSAFLYFGFTICLHTWHFGGKGPHLLCQGRVCAQSLSLTLPPPD